MIKKDTERQTLVEEGTEFTGTMRARCKVVVRGSMDGDLEAPALEVTEAGTMTGSVKAKSVHSRGVLAGSVEADEISLAGIVRSNTVIRAKNLSVNLASQEGRLEVTFGDTVLEVGEMPSDQPTDVDVSAAEKSTKNAEVALLAGTSSNNADASATEDATEPDDTDAPGRRRGRKAKADDTPEQGVETSEATAPVQ